ncbi:Uncharacterised protein [Mycobacterium tuberculosis]|uniref:Uncharacterized protein n=1 Tax=Mycobacterium tuberculosis TaxID=1773 RepID=A0A655A4S8_MYCTX|nr:Uncharacterised protein [Mycobacterium tuberculosis]CKT43254.1 Uncharacterised protein [Mycobacterium tuberculosis]COZ49094.1 Uncharacterised protein [Mycobacterium tuberculosis]
MVLKPPSVPISRTRRAWMAPASRHRNLPCCADTAMRGNSAASLAANAAANAGSSPTSVLSKNASTSGGLGCWSMPKR